MTTSACSKLLESLRLGPNETTKKNSVDGKELKCLHPKTYRLSSVSAIIVKHAAVDMPVAFPFDLPIRFIVKLFEVLL